MHRRRFILIACLAVGICYAGSYLVLSRRGYAEARAVDAVGFYYFSPTPTRRWRILNNGSRIIFAPLNRIDQWIGTGKPPASEPMWSVS